MGAFRIVLWLSVFVLGGFLAYATINHTAQNAGLKESIGVGGDIGGPFTAMRTDGSPFTQQDMLGKPHVLFFGFTELLEQYLSAFDKRITGLSGGVEQIEKLAKAWRVFVQKGPQEDGIYDVNHTTTTYLMNAEGGFVRTIAYGESAEVAVEKLQKLIAGR